MTRVAINGFGRIGRTSFAPLSSAGRTTSSSPSTTSVTSGRPGRAGPALRRGGRRRAHVPRHLRLARGTRHHAQHRVANGRAGVHPADRRRRDRLRGRRGHAAPRGRRQDRGEHRRHPPPRAGRRDRRPVRQPGAGALARRAPRRRHDLRLRGHDPRRRKSAGLDAVEWARRATDLGAGEILLNAMDADGTSGRLRPRADPPGPAPRSRSRSSPAAERARSSTSLPPSTPAPTPSSPPPSSTSAPSASPR